MVGKHTHGDIILEIIAVGLTRFFLNKFNEWNKQVGIVVGSFLLNGSNKSLESHPGIHVLSR